MRAALFCTGTGGLGRLAGWQEELWVHQAGLIRLCCICLCDASGLEEKKIKWEHGPTSPGSSQFYQ